MALRNFEKHIKKSIENRVITPSETSWDRLNAMLCIGEEKKSSANKYWLQIAASLILFISIGYFLNIKNSVEKPTEQKNKTSIVQKNMEGSTNTNTIENKTTPSDYVETSTALKLNLPSTIKQNNSEITSSSVQQANTSIEQKNETLPIAEVEKRSYSYITPERLLAEIEGTKTTSINTKTFKPVFKVNANELLLTVEKELNQSFKEKALQKFKEVKSAFANRNYE